MTKKDELENNGICTIGITYDCTDFGSGGTLIYYYKVNNVIYKGSMSRGNAKCPKAYYRVIYSSKNPSLSKLHEDTLFPDSLGCTFIKWEEIK